MVPNEGASRVWGSVAVSALVVVLVAAAADADRSWERIRAMPMEQRTKFLQNLRRFDLELTADQQRPILDLDRRVRELDAGRQSEYFAALHRYHVWLGRLPEHRKQEVLSKPPSERMALIQKLVAEYPVPQADTPQPLRIAELGEYSTFELASIFQIWQAAGPAQRERVEQSPPTARGEALFRLGDTLKIPREIRPAAFDEEHWVARLESNGRNGRWWLPAEELIRKKPEAARDEVVKRKLEARRREIVRRQAINLYLTQAEVRPVTPERLSQFVSLLPSWIQSSLDELPPDEARRRLAFAYRQVFPYPEELKPARSAAASPAQSRPTPPTPPTPVTASKATRPVPTKRPPEAPVGSPF